MTLDKAINLLVPITLIEMMIAIGLGVSLREAFAAFRRWGVVVRAMVANYVFVPAATVVLLFLWHANPMISAGFFILAVCPGAAYGPPATRIAGGNVNLAVVLMIILAGSSAIVGPLLLRALLPLAAGDSSVQINLAGMVITLLITQLLPLCAGLAIRNWYPKVAGKMSGSANRLSALLNVATIVLIVVAKYHTFLAIRVRGVLGMLTLLVVSLACGWLVAAVGRDDRKSMTLTTALRNVGIGLVIANSAFAGTPALDAVVAYGLFGVVASLLVASVWSRIPSERGHAMAAVC